MKKTAFTDVRPKEEIKTKKSPLLKQTITTRNIKQSVCEPLNTRTVKKSAPESLTNKSSRVTQESRNSSYSSSRKKPAEMASKKVFAVQGDIASPAAQVTQTQVKLQMYNYGIQTGSQPQSGRMTHRISPLQHIPGFPRVGSIIIDYDFPSGVQEWYSPNSIPAKYTRGLNILQMLKKAFDHRLVFTIGDSRTTGANDVITWNDIHHKTSIYGGPESFGYPDAGYLIRVKEELAAKGITSP
ncbi:probable E3 ubiquitin-protein ligase DTX3 [Pomacea canaliculata]|uniref:probable E3 ubiquitin-protein ligase DTX3 n=1 Tax=Pomacea canaliculata TaxID=400727 RepID=UPI000D739A81|nr:probable E3 ubiquitin-protein ligase DTX3 [Pomacea canaliculata]